MVYERRGEKNESFTIQFVCHSTDTNFGINTQNDRLKIMHLNIRKKWKCVWCEWQLKYCCLFRYCCCFLNGVNLIKLAYIWHLCKQISVKQKQQQQHHHKKTQSLTDLWKCVDVLSTFFIQVNLPCNGFKNICKLQLDE